MTGEEREGGTTPPPRTAVTLGDDRMIQDAYFDALALAAGLGTCVSVHLPGERLTATVVTVTDSDVLLEVAGGPRFVPLAHINSVEAPLPPALRSIGCRTG